MKAHANRLTDTIDAPSRLEVEKLCYALIADDPQEGHRIIESVYQDGASLDAIYLNYLAEAATVLGEWWDTDFVSFFEVSIGTSRIYSILRGLSHLFQGDIKAQVKTAVFATIPDETHILGVRMAADLFAKEGWEIDLIVGKTHDELVEQISRSSCRIIGLSAGGKHSAAALARLVIALRISNPAAAIFLSGQITSKAKDVIEVMGLDGVVSDIPSALELANDIWDRSTTQ